MLCGCIFGLEPRRPFLYFDVSSKLDYLVWRLVSQTAFCSAAGLDYQDRIVLCREAGIGEICRLQDWD